MARGTTHRERLIELFESERLVRTRDLKPLGIPRVYLSRLMQEGLIHRVHRGLYEFADASVGRWDTLAEVTHLVPKATICLLSALQVHDLTTQASHKVWIALPQGMHPPKVTGVRLEIVYMRASVLPPGSVQTIEHPAGSIPVTTPSKTVADTFKFRKRVGMDVALEALKAYVEAGESPDALLREAERNHVASLVRPALEGLLA